jgi:ATP-binding cassette subfamily C protein CydC
VKSDPVLLVLRLALQERSAILLAGLTGAATVGAAVGLLGTGAWLIATAALQPAIADIQVAVVGVRFFGISRAVMRYLERLVAHDATFRMLARVREWFMEVLVPLAPARLVDRSSGDLVARGVSDVQALEPLVVRVFGPAVAAFVVGAGATLFLALVADTAALPFAAGYLGLAVGIPLLVVISRRRHRAGVAEARASLSSAVVDLTQGLADLVAFGRASEARERTVSASESLRSRTRADADNDAVTAGLSTAFTHGTGLLVVLLAVPAVRAGSLDPVMLGVLGLVAVAAFEAAAALPPAARELEDQLHAARRLVEIAELVPAVAAVSDAAGAVPARRRADIVLEDVSFTHPGAMAPALDGVSLSIPAGSRLAVVGATGSGKSTLGSLLARVWDPDHGRVLVDGDDLRSLPLEGHRRRLGVVGQRPFLFAGTVAENLRLVAADAPEAELRRALEIAGLWRDVDSWPDGLKTPVGEHGRRLSGGQRQRLAVARAVLQDPAILILDEATSALDPPTAWAMLEALDGALGDRTRIHITHRLVDMEGYDRIAVLDRGRLVQQGRHRDLVDQDGVYRQLIRAQEQRLAG